MYYKYSGAGNTFAIVDGRDETPAQLSELLTPESIELVCTELTTDGLMVLNASEAHDFAMEYYNRDGSGGMMCGNGGRCITAFADHVGIKPAYGKVYHFEAPDGVHTAEILSRDGYECMVRLGMLDVPGIHYYQELSEAPVDGFFLNTGTRHFVVFDEEVEDKDGNVSKEVVIYGDYPSYGSIQKYIEDKGYELVSGGFERIPNTELKEVSAEQRSTIDKLVGLLEDDEDVTNVYTTMKPGEDA